MAGRTLVCQDCGRAPRVPGCWYWCADCNAKREAEGSRKSEIQERRVEARRANNPDWALPDHADIRWRERAIGFVLLAKKLGILPELDGSYACVDCGAAATVYEHRDYTRPLAVEPVCRPCNHKRGTAKWPTAADFNFKRIEHK